MWKKSIIRVVNCERYNKYNNGILISLEFKVKNDAEAGFYPISIPYSPGDFTNWQLNKIMPQIVIGGVAVNWDGTNSVHKYVTNTVLPTCTEGGYTVYTCSDCENSYTGNYMPALGHDFGDLMLDYAPTLAAAGTASRHCSRCMLKTDARTIDYPKCDSMIFPNGQPSTIQFRINQSRLDTEILKNIAVYFSLNGELTKVTDYTQNNNYYIFSFQNSGGFQPSDKILSWLSADVGSTEITGETVERSVTLIRNDIDGNGICDSGDMISLKKFLLNISNIDSGDLTGDGRVDIKDFVRIKKYLILDL